MKPGQVYERHGSVPLTPILILEATPTHVRYLMLAYGTVKRVTQEEARLYLDGSLLSEHNVRWELARF